MASLKDIFAQGQDPVNRVLILFIITKLLLGEDGRPFDDKSVAHQLYIHVPFFYL